MTDADTLRLIRDAAESLATFDAGRVRGWRDTAPGFDRALWREMAEQGWLGILVDEAAGGLGLGLDAAATVARALGAAAAPEPFVAAGVMAPRILATCPGGQARLPAVMSGEQVACLAWQNTSGSLDFAASQVIAAAAGTGVKLSGECRFAPVAHADAFIVLARTDNGPALYWLPADSAGLSVEPEAHADGSASAWLSFNGVDVPSDNLLAGPDHAPAILARAIDEGIVTNCAELMGMMDRALELTLDYLKTRKQFGQAIGAFQVLQHRAVDLWMHKEVAGHATDAAVRLAGAPDVPPAARARAASGAKARVAQVALEMANETVQLHGAIGFTDEYDLGLYVNRTLALVPFLGNAAEHRARYGTFRQNAGAAA